MLRVMFYALVVKGYKNSFIEDTDTLVLTIGQFNLSQTANYRCIQTAQFVSNDSNSCVF